MIDVSGIDADAGRAGDQEFAFGGRGRGHLWLVDDASGNTRLRVAVDTRPGYDFEVIIRDGDVMASDYTSFDFVL